MELKDSGVVFIEDTHTYLLGHLELKGITSTLIPAIFGDYTAGIPEEIKQRAAERGTRIHDNIQMMEEGFAYGGYEIDEYKRLRDALGLRYVTNEYIVTDGEYFASKIDIVYEDDIIADIKTSAELHEPEVTFQLSWYAAMYERLNGRPVRAAYAIHLPKEGSRHGCTAKAVTLVSPLVMEDIVRAYLAGQDVTSFAPLFGALPVVKTAAADLPAAVGDAVRTVVAYERTMKEVKARGETLLADCKRIIMDYLVSAASDGIEEDTFAIRRVAATVRTSIDSKALKKAHPDIYKEFLKETAVAESLRITIK